MMTRKPDLDYYGMAQFTRAQGVGQSGVQTKGTFWGVTFLLLYTGLEQPITNWAKHPGHTPWAQAWIRRSSGKGIAGYLGSAGS